MMWFTLVFLFITIIRTVDSACSNCNKCVDNKCINPDESKCRCEYGCKPGYYGNKCGNTCPGKCVSCGRQYGLSDHPTYGVCYECSDGYYNGSSSNCFYTCPHNCKQCTSTTNCTVCNSGWYGGVCASQCPPDCRDNVCSITDGSCTQGCVNGKYGTRCSYQCPTTCKDDICDQTAGTCTNGCIDNFAPGADSKCHDCIPGKYGENCTSACLSKTCFNNECDRKNGNCSKGCTSPTITGTYCDSCISGTYGDTCQFTCPNNCKDNVCSRHQGECTKDCKTVQFTGSKCNQCIVGYYGEHCNSTCPLNCQYNCTKDNGECSWGCVSYYAGKKCDVCITGYHGDKCDKTCSDHCANTTCSQDGGECIYGCTDGFQGQDCSEALSLVEHPGSTIAGPVAGGVSGVLAIIAIAVVVLIFFRRRKHRDDHLQSALKQFPRVSDSSTTPALGENNAQATYANERDTHHELEESVDDDNEQTEGGYDVDPEYINIAESKTDIHLSDLYKLVSKADNGYFKKEFEQLPRATSHACMFARKPENKSLNRFKGIYPYDHSRVKLKCDPNFFINACYIDGYKANKAYIASVGPTSDITNKFISFWKMVWYEKADIIVMLTNFNEPSGMKCEQYWPGDGKSFVYGDITVTHQGTNAYAEYSLTRLTVAKDKQQRSLTHLHYTAWPDKSVPDNVVSLVEFRQRVSAIKTVTGGPTIVHCSAGVGRTGTYIALDILTDQGKAEHTINVFDCVMNLREQRVNMVQTHEQYEYLYRGVVYTLTFGSDPVTVNNVQTYVAKLNDKWYAKQFQLLDHNVETELEDENEARITNKLQSVKNRQGADIPGNRARPRLFLNRAFNEPDYINAIYINSFKKMNRYIAAQTPLPASLSDFLCLIYQNECSCIVDMNDTFSYDKHQVGMYLPVVNQTVKVDSYTVSCSDLEVKSTYIKSILTVKNSSKQRPGHISVEHYQYTGWQHDGEVPDNVGQFVQFVNTVQIAADNQMEDSSPMLIHCLNAFERSGLFCTLAVLLEKLEFEQQVSIGNTIRQIRLRRHRVIPNKAQYKFCHECAAAYTDMFSTYSNFAI